MKAIRKVPKWVLVAEESVLRELALRSIRNETIGDAAQAPAEQRLFERLRETVGQTSPRAVTEEERIIAAWQSDGYPVVTGKRGKEEWGRWGWIGRFGSKRVGEAVSVAVNPDDLLPLKDPCESGSIGEKSDRGGQRGRVRQEEIKAALLTLSKADVGQVQHALQEIHFPAKLRAAFAGILNSREAAAFLELTDRTVRRYAREGRIGEKVGPRRFVFSLDQLKEFKAQKRIVGKHLD